MLQYRTNAGERRKPALGLYGELTVEQSLAQERLAQVRRGGVPAAEKAAARQAPTVKELCIKFMEDYSSQRNKPGTQEGYQSVIDRNIIPMLGRMKVQDLKRPDVASIMKKMAHKTMAMFMRYVHTEDKPVREMAELVAKRRKTITGMQLAKEVVA